MQFVVKLVPVGLHDTKVVIFAHAICSCKWLVLVTYFERYYGIIIDIYGLSAEQVNTSVYI